MPSALAIVGTPIRTDLTLNELPRALAAESPELVVYEWKPIPGRIMGAAFDWVAVLGITADLLAVAGALWTVYERFIKARAVAETKQPPALLIQVQVKNEQHTFVQFVIQEGASKDAFAEEFVRTTSALRASESGASEETIIETYESSVSHRRVHVRRDA